MTLLNNSGNNLHRVVKNYETFCDIIQNQALRQMMGKLAYMQHSVRAEFLTDQEIVLYEATANEFLDLFIVNKC